MLSDLVTWGEEFTAFFEPGLYRCARCGAGIYSSEDKWKGPCGENFSIAEEWT